MFDGTPGEPEPDCGEPECVGIAVLVAFALLGGAVAVAAATFMPWAIWSEFWWP